jgi:hypothetical protein
MAIKTCVALLLLLGGSSAASAAQLVEGYYNKTCPNVEAIVREEMEKIISAAPSLAGPLLRLHFHDLRITDMKCRYGDTDTAIQRYRDQAKTLIP